jgi:hypothetical protein
LSALPIPRHSRLLGYAGLLPFAGLAVLVWASSDHQADASFALLAYGAVILSFLGGTWWGRNFSVGASAHPGQIAAIAASLCGWSAVLIAYFTEPVFGFALLLLGFLGCWIADLVTVRQNLAYWPVHYMHLRLHLTLGAVISLAASITRLTL